MVYTGDLKSPAFWLAGSSPASRTKNLYAAVAEWSNATDCKSVKP
jgi:hypothetical protein